MESIKDPETLDARWFKRFEALSFEDYEKLSGSKLVREQEKTSFLSSEKINPDLDYPELETFDIEAREEQLLSLKEDILELEPNEAVRKIYRTKINELLATVRMLRATREKDDRRFSRYSDFIYGKPNEDDLNYVIKHVQELVGANLASADADKQAAAERLQGIFGDLVTHPDFGVSRDILPDGESITGSVQDVEEAKLAFTEALEELGIDDWDIVVDSEKGLSNFSVSQEHKIIRIPSEEKLLERKISKKKLRGLIAHEIQTHVLRRHNGERSKLQLLGLGLDRYLKAEEGIATYNEQQVTGATEFAGVPRFFSIAVAKGIDGQKRDFRETFEIVKDYRLLSSLAKETGPEKAAKTAYDDCVRIFRGTTGKTPGAIYPKDMSYFGNRAIWTLVSKDSDVVHQFGIGKYDPNNSEHVALLSQLGILDEDLAELDAQQ